MADVKRSAPKKGDLVVTATLVVAHFQGGRVGNLAKGDVVPDGVTPESLEHLRSLGFVAEPKQD